MSMSMKRLSWITVRLPCFHVSPKFADLQVRLSTADVCFGKFPCFTFVPCLTVAVIARNEYRHPQRQPKLENLPSSSRTRSWDRYCSVVAVHLSSREFRCVFVHIYQILT